MSKRSWKRWVGGASLLVVLLLAGAAFLLLGRTTTVELADGVHLLSTGNGLSPIGANVVVFSSDGSSIVVDAQLAPLSRRIARLVGRGGTSIDGVVNTHWHPDHTGGNGAIAAGAPIYAHPTVLDRMRSPAGRVRPHQTRVIPSLRPS